jgi:hypothetical protein
MSGIALGTWTHLWTIVMVTIMVTMMVTMMVVMVEVMMVVVIIIIGGRVGCDGFYNYCGVGGSSGGGVGTKGDANIVVRVASIAVASGWYHFST